MESDISGNSIQQCVDMARQHHMNLAQDIMEDSRDFLRPWRRRLRDTLALKETEALRFLETPRETWPSVIRHEQLVAGLYSTTNPSAYLADVVDNAQIVKTIHEELGVHLTTVKDTLHSVMDSYQKTLKRLFELDTILNESVERLDSLSSWLLDIPTIDTDVSDEGTVLKEAIMGYLRSYYKRWNIETNYKEFCKVYAQFVAYRSVIFSLHSAKELAHDAHGAPTCSICTTDHITLVLIPCGHSFCNSCGQKQRSQCYICRCTVSNRQRIYFT